MQTFTTHSEAATRTVAAELAKTLKGSEIILLEGELGAGKTAFTKGLAAALGIPNEIVSPTFTLMQVYEIKSQNLPVKNLVHIDTYRLEEASELQAIGVEDYLGDSKTICVIEWPEKIKKLLDKKQTIHISFESIDPQTRRITIS